MHGRRHVVTLRGSVSSPSTSSSSPSFSPSIPVLLSCLFSHQPAACTRLSPESRTRGVFYFSARLKKARKRVAHIYIVGAFSVTDIHTSLCHVPQPQPPSVILP